MSDDKVLALQRHFARAAAIHRARRTVDGRFRRGWPKLVALAKRVHGGGDMVAVIEWWKFEAADARAIIADPASLPHNRVMASVRLAALAEVSESLAADLDLDGLPPEA